MKIVGLCGYSKVGKDTAAANMPGWTRFAYADTLKADLAPLLEMVGCSLENPRHKEMARALLVEWGRTARLFRPGFWISRLDAAMMASTAKNVVVTDCRYPNEVESILELGGKVIRIYRPGIVAANEEEDESIRQIDMAWILPGVLNSKTPEALGKAVMEFVE